MVFSWEQQNEAFSTDQAWTSSDLTLNKTADRIAAKYSRSRQSTPQWTAPIVILVTRARLLPEQCHAAAASDSHHMLADQACDHNRSCSQNTDRRREQENVVWLHDDIYRSSVLEIVKSEPRWHRWEKVAVHIGHIAKTQIINRLCSASICLLHILHNV